MGSATGRVSGSPRQWVLRAGSCLMRGESLLRGGPLAVGRKVMPIRVPRVRFPGQTGVAGAVLLGRGPQIDGPDTPGEGSGRDWGGFFQG
jgi:hypothetical protein